MAAIPPYGIIDIGHFIAEVKKYPEIWNFLLKELRNDRLGLRAE